MPSAPLRTSRILLTEDNADVAEVGRAVLAERGHDVVVCVGATEALALLARDHFDIVCSDLVMPGEMGGLDLARTIRERHPALPSS